jgi:hypothetical protein
MASSRTEEFPHSHSLSQANSDHKENQPVNLTFDKPVQAATGVHYGDIYYLNAPDDIKKHQKRNNEKEIAGPLESEEDRIWISFCKNLKAEYRKGKYIQRLFYPKHPLPLEENYIHLTLVNDKQGMEFESKLKQVYKKKYIPTPVGIKTEIKDIYLMPDDPKLLEQGKLYIKRSETDLSYLIVVDEDSHTQRGSISQTVLQERCQPAERELIGSIFESETFDIDLIRPLLPTLLNSINNQQQYLHHQETEVVRTYEELFNPLRPCELSEVIQCERVLITGIAGVGKTTLSQYVCYVWAQEDSANAQISEREEYELKKWRNKTGIVIRIALRDLMNGSTQITAETAAIDFLWEYMKLQYGGYLFSEDTSLDQEQIQEVVKSRLKQEQTAGRLVLILDGYDEIAKKIFDLPSLEKELLKKLLITPRFILTSRPYYLEDLESKLKCSYDKTYRVTGFSNENIGGYINNFFSHLIQPKKELGIALKNYLQRNRSLWGTSHVPINLELICSAWDHHPFEQESLTMTNLYDKVVLFLCKRYLEKYKPHYKVSTMLDEDVLQICKQEIDFLKHLAFMGIFNQELVTALRDSLHYVTSQFKPQDPVEWRSKFVEEILEAGFLKSIGKGRGEAEKHYYFPHRTFQEYFAACYFMDCLLDKSVLPLNKKSRVRESWRAYVLENRYDVTLEVMWWFVAGQLSLHQENDPSSSCLKDFFNELLGTGDTIGHYQFMLAVRCWDETRAATHLLNKELENSLFLGLEMILNGIELSYLRPLMDRLLLSGFMRRSRFLNNFVQKQIEHYIDLPENHQIQKVIQFTHQIEFIPDAILLKEILKIVKDSTKKHRFLVGACLWRLLLQISDEAYHEIQPKVIQLIKYYSSISRDEYQHFLQQMEGMEFHIDKPDRILQWLKHKDVFFQKIALVLMKKSDSLFFREHFEKNLIHFIEQQQSSELYLTALSAFLGRRSEFLEDSLQQEKISHCLMTMPSNQNNKMNTFNQRIPCYSLLESKYFLPHIDPLIQDLLDLERPDTSVEIVYVVLSFLATKSRVSITSDHLDKLKKLLHQKMYNDTIKAIDIALLDQLPLFIQRFFVFNLLARPDEYFLTSLIQQYECKTVELDSKVQKKLFQYYEENPELGKIHINLLYYIFEYSQGLNVDFLRAPFAYDHQCECPVSLLLPFVNSSSPMVLEMALSLIEWLTHWSELEEERATCYERLIECFTCLPFEAQEKILHIIGKEKNYFLISSELDQLIDILMSYWRGSDLKKKILALPWLLYFPLTKENKKICIDHIIEILAKSSADQSYYPILQFFSSYYLLLSIVNEEPREYVEDHIAPNVITGEEKDESPNNAFAPLAIQREAHRLYQGQCFRSYADQIMQSSSEEGKKAWNYALCAMPYFMMEIFEGEVMRQEINAVNKLTLSVYRIFYKQPMIQLWNRTNKLNTQVKERRGKLLDKALLEECKESARWVRNYTEEKYQVINNDYDLPYIPYVPPISIGNFIQNISVTIRLYHSEDKTYCPRTRNDPLVFQTFKETNDEQWAPWICEFYKDSSSVKIEGNISRFFQRKDKASRKEHTVVIKMMSTYCHLIRYKYAPWNVNIYNGVIRPPADFFTSLDLMIKEIDLGNALIENLLQSDMYYKAYNATIDFLAQEDLSDELCDLDFSQIEQSDLEHASEKTPLPSILENYFKLKNRKLIPVIANRLAKENKTIEMREEEIYLHGKTLECISHQLTKEEASLFLDQLRRSFFEIYRVNPNISEVAPSSEKSAAELVVPLEEKEEKEKGVGSTRPSGKKEDGSRQATLPGTIERPPLKGPSAIGAVIFAIGIAQWIEHSKKEANDSSLPWSSVLLMLLGAGTWVYYSRCYQQHRFFNRAHPVSLEDLKDEKRERTPHLKSLQPS